MGKNTDGGHGKAEKPSIHSRRRRSLFALREPMQIREYDGVDEVMPARYKVVM